MTISWSEIYDYIRCPKIVSFKAAGLKTRTITSRKPPAIEPHVAGKIGEQVVEIFLQPLTSPEFDLDITEEAADIIEESGGSASLPESLIKRMAMSLFRRRPDLKKKLLKRLEELRLPAGNEIIRSMIDQAIAGIQISALTLREKYGEMELLGHAEVKASVLPSYLRPDFIFKPRKSNAIMIVEVKNKAKITAQDRFQASFYASLGMLGGIAVREHITLEGPSLAPMSILKPQTHCILLNVRTGFVEEVPAEIDVMSLLRGIWEAKQLGLIGKQPDAELREYCRKCRWKKFCSHFSSSGPPVAALNDLAKPVPLIIAKGLLDQGVNLNLLWWEKYIYEYDWSVRCAVRQLERSFSEELNSALERGLSVSDWMELRRRFRERIRKLYEDTLRETLEHLGLDDEEIRALLNGPVSQDDFNKACEEFKSEIERWEDIMKRLGYTVECNPWLNMHGFRKYTTLPRMSGKLTEDAWKWWMW